jgi:hypothetical protein
MRYIIIKSIETNKIYRLKTTEEIPANHIEYREPKTFWVKLFPFLFPVFVWNKKKASSRYANIEIIKPGSIWEIQNSCSCATLTTPIIDSYIYRMKNARKP